MRFAYPIAHLGKFCGCGRYVAQPPNWVKAPYTEANPDAADMGNVPSAASYLAPESSDSDYRVYEKRDQPEAPHHGSSLGLAYLLAYINRSRPLRLNWTNGSHETSAIWATGEIHMEGGHPCLGVV